MRWKKRISSRIRRKKEAGVWRLEVKWQFSTTSQDFIHGENIWVKTQRRRASERMLEGRMFQAKGTSRAKIGAQLTHEQERRWSWKGVGYGSSHWNSGCWGCRLMSGIMDSSEDFGFDAESNEEGWQVSRREVTWSDSCIKKATMALMGGVANPNSPLVIACYLFIASLFEEVVSTQHLHFFSCHSLLSLPFHTHQYWQWPLSAIWKSIWENSKLTFLSLLLL